MPTTLLIPPRIFRPSYGPAVWQSSQPGLDRNDLVIITLYIMQYRAQALVHGPAARPPQSYNLCQNDGQASQPTNLQYTLKSCPYSSLGAAEAAEAAAAAASLHHLVIKSFINPRLFLGKVFAKNARGNSVVVSNNSSAPFFL